MAYLILGKSCRTGGVPTTGKARFHDRHLFFRLERTSPLLEVLPVVVS
jgi:hypothetical protein